MIYFIHMTKPHKHRYYSTVAMMLCLLLSLLPLSANAKLCADYSATKLLAKAAPFASAINRYAAQYGVDANLIRSVIVVESCFKPIARSHAGARGLMQLMPATAKRFNVYDSYNSTQNIRGGTRYLRFLTKRFDGKLSFILAGYNAGEGNVDKYKGIPPFKETQRYIYDVLRVYGKLAPHKLTESDYKAINKYASTRGLKGLHKRPRQWIDPFLYSQYQQRIKTKIAPNYNFDPLLIVGVKEKPRPLSPLLLAKKRLHQKKAAQRYHARQIKNRRTVRNKAHQALAQSIYTHKKHQKKKLEALLAYDKHQ